MYDFCRYRYHRIENINFMKKQSVTTPKSHLKELELIIEGIKYLLPLFNNLILQRLYFFKSRQILRIDPG